MIQAHFLWNEKIFVFFILLDEITQCSSRMRWLSNTIWEYFENSWWVASRCYFKKVWVIKTMKKINNQRLIIALQHSLRNHCCDRFSWKFQYRNTTQQISFILGDWPLSRPQDYSERSVFIMSKDTSRGIRLRKQWV